MNKHRRKPETALSFPAGMIHHCPETWRKETGLALELLMRHPQRNIKEE